MTSQFVILPSVRADSRASGFIFPPGQGPNFTPGFYYGTWYGPEEGKSRNSSPPLSSSSSEAYQSTGSSTRSIAGSDRHHSQLPYAFRTVPGKAIAYESQALPRHVPAKRNSTTSIPVKTTNHATYHLFPSITSKFRRNSHTAGSPPEKIVSYPNDHGKRRSSFSFAAQHKRSDSSSSSGSDVSAPELQSSCKSLIRLTTIKSNKSRYDDLSRLLHRVLECLRRVQASLECSVQYAISVRPADSNDLFVALDSLRRDIEALDRIPRSTLESRIKAVFATLDALLVRVDGHNRIHIVDDRILKLSLKHNKLQQASAQTRADVEYLKSTAKTLMHHEVIRRKEKELEQGHKEREEMRRQIKQLKLESGSLQDERKRLLGGKSVRWAPF